MPSWSRFYFQLQCTQRRGQQCTNFGDWKGLDCGYLPGHENTHRYTIFLQNLGLFRTVIADSTFLTCWDVQSYLSFSFPVSPPQQCLRSCEGLICPASCWLLLWQDRWVQSLPVSVFRNTVEWAQLTAVLLCLVGVLNVSVLCYSLSCHSGEGQTMAGVGYSHGTIQNDCLWSNQWTILFLCYRWLHTGRCWLELCSCQAGISSVSSSSTTCCTMFTIQFPLWLPRTTAPKGI